MVQIKFVLLVIILQTISLLAQQLDRRTFNSCRTSTSDSGEGDRGQLDTPCQFPFSLRNKTYYSCTFDYSHITGYKPWCSTRVDKNGNHISGGKNWGVCDDKQNCPIPPRHCGEPVRTRRLPNERDDDVDFEQMPWMVSLGTYNDNNRKWQHECGGSLITSKHVLSAAHCFDYKVDIKSYRMRLGSADFTNPSEGFQERRVVQILSHPKYQQNRAYFDAGIAVADRHIEFTEYVRPICLPMTPVDDEDYFADDFVTLAGWGQQYNPNTDTYEQADKLKLHTLQVNPKEICEDIFSLQSLRDLNIPAFRLGQLPYGFQKDISCVGNDFEIGEGACNGDSGSPVIRRISNTARGNPYFEQHFIVSTGIDCRLRATIYTRISNREVLLWIQKVSDTSPLLMVVGGYNTEKKLLNDVELVSATPNNVCSKHVRPIFGRAYQYEDGSIKNEGEMLGHVGVFAQDAPRVCGGKNAFDNLNTCYEFNATVNRWYEMPSMKHKRYLASAVLDNDDNMWVLGGTANSQPAEGTEIFRYQPPPRTSRWRRGRPLPEDLRDSGLQSHCAVRLNRTHVFIAGGFASAYRPGDPLTEQRDRSPEGESITLVPRRNRRQADGSIGGGVALNRAWLYDGYYWNEVADMSFIRDRPACSLVNMPDGSVRVLVAGGCIGWCVSNGPESSAELYNAETDTWTRVADLPTPLSSAKMDMLDGLPTIIGGYDGTKTNDVLYQYKADRDQWVANPDVKLRLGRSSAAVFQVPKTLFKYC